MRDARFFCFVFVLLFCLCVYVCVRDSLPLQVHYLLFHHRPPTRLSFHLFILLFKSGEVGSMVLARTMDSSWYCVPWWGHQIHWPKHLVKLNVLGPPLFHKPLRGQLRFVFGLFDAFTCCPTIGIILPWKMTACPNATDRMQLVRVGPYNAPTDGFGHRSRW